MLDTLREKANNLPLLPGVYIMLDSKGEVIYVGKAKKLKNRVSSYFHGEHLPKVAAMVEKVADFNVIVAGSEFEALVLENSLIKRHKPHYNILLKDDKGYPFIRVDVKSEYPTMTIASRAGKDGARYFGPYGGRSQTRDIIHTISRALLLPDCSRSFPRDIGKERPCLNYHMGSCAGWCLADSSRDDYMARMHQALLILDGKSEELIADLKKSRSVSAFGHLQASHIAYILGNNLGMNDIFCFCTQSWTEQIQKLQEAGPDDLFVIFSASGEYFKRMDMNMHFLDKEKAPKIYMVTFADSKVQMHRKIKKIIIGGHNQWLQANAAMNMFANYLSYRLRAV